MNSVATGNSQEDLEDTDSDVCLLSRRDDESLSSVDDHNDDDDQDMRSESPTVPLEQPCSMTQVWGNPGTRLYQAMEVLVTSQNKTTTDNNNGHQRLLSTPSALQADVLSQQVHDQVQQKIMQEHGTDEQRDLWKKASDEQQHEWIASFFLSTSTSSS
jgi:hypothetical protein